MDVWPGNRNPSLRVQLSDSSAPTRVSTFPAISNCPRVATFPEVRNPGIQAATPSSDGLSRDGWKGAQARQKAHSDKVTQEASDPKAVDLFLHNSTAGSRQLLGWVGY